jgi:hypothetical protein
MSEEKKRPQVETAKILSSVKFLAPDDDAGRKSLPNVYDILCPRWKKGVLVRQPGRLTLRVEGGAYLLVLEAPTERLQTSVIVHSLASALADLEKAISSSGCNWGPTWAARKKNLPTLDDLVE